ncbi:DUF397 domain-containing protein [Spiractinospora alimapuensis]|uniref:DUF397 domain-containing protein n=1 Tax=Spiractinospora alimapuensis TaxID=2820884 RepID=UPI001F3E8EC4|nr:DUF397 domain-containing protein [Spiractinospora alimapuensis]QVQ54391.1 DUF397 domain-containing protein [Spiractinospora alimapuensis]
MSEWRKSSYSDTGGQCVEVRMRDGGIDVRDTMNREAGHLSFGHTEWNALLDLVKSHA